MKAAPAPAKKTPAEHRDYVEQIARLSFWFAYGLQPRIPTLDLGEILVRHTPLCYHALRFQDYRDPRADPGCRRALDLARAAARGLPPGPQGAARFEQTMAVQLRSLIDERADQWYASSVGIAPLTAFWEPRLIAGSLKFDPPAAGRPPTTCNFHIANAIAPQSIFANPAYLPSCFLDLMNCGEQAYGFDTLATTSWLNDEPRWLRLFPADWHRTLDAPDPHGLPSWHFGYWGQLVTARGTFNAKAGEFVRRHGRLRFRTRSAHCAFRAMRDHLRGLAVPGVP